MRRYTCGTVLGVLLAVCWAGVHAAEWEQYFNEELGFSVSFPGMPEEKTGSYTTRRVPNVVSHYALVATENAAYSAAVVETGENDGGLTILGDADFTFSQLGDVVLNTAYRTGEDYGRFMILDCREDFVALSQGAGDTGDQARRMLSAAAGLECPTGSRMTMTILFKNGRLYLISGVASGAGAKREGGPGRFAHSIAWAGANSSPMDRAQRGE